MYIIFVALLAWLASGSKGNGECGFKMSCDTDPLESFMSL